MSEQTIPSDFIDLANVQDRHEQELMDKPNVVGVALGHKITGGEDTGERAVSVLVEHKVPTEDLSEDDLVPPTLDDAPVDVVDVGVIHAGHGILEDAAPATDATGQEDLLVGAQTLKKRVRPVEGGYSIGHYRITAGTYATACYDAVDFPGMPRRYYALSNNHVLANSNHARVGDPILQPGPADGGTIPGDIVARLSRWIPIRFDGSCNLVDAAIAQGEFHDLDREVYWVGSIKTLYSAPTVGDIVQKTGRTTNFTTGRVLNINATVNVGYGGSNVAKFCRQILTTNMSAPGDSGSLVTDLDEGGVGLLFAGSPQVTVVNNLAFVLALLKIRITEK